MSTHDGASAGTEPTDEQARRPRGCVLRRAESAAFAPQVKAVAGLCHKAGASLETATHTASHTRRALTAALDAANALPTGEDCLVKAFAALSALARVMYLDAAARSAAQSEHDALLLSVVAVLRRRAAAGTLDDARLRPHERLFWSSCCVGLHYTLNRAPDVKVKVGLGWYLYFNAATSALSALCYGLTFPELFTPICQPGLAPGFVTPLCQLRQLRLHDAWDLELRAYIIEVFTTMADTPGVPYVAVMAGLVTALLLTIKKFLDSGPGARMEWFMPVVQAWNQAVKSPLGMRAEKNAPALSQFEGSRGERREQLAADILRHCALGTCKCREKSFGMFKLCSRCRTVVYCCKEHQAEDWPAHKVACKAARKAASVSSGAGGAAALQ